MTKGKYQGNTQEEFFVKPENQHLFKPGQSGNPAGRPKGSLNKDDVWEIANGMGVEPISIIAMIVTGKTKELTTKTGVDFKQMSPALYTKLVMYLGDKIYANPKETNHIVSNESNKKTIVQIEYPTQAGE